MEKIKSLNRYQKSVLIFMIAMALVFAVVYPALLRRTGVAPPDSVGGSSVRTAVFLSVYSLRYCLSGFQAECWAVVCLGIAICGQYLPALRNRNPMVSRSFDADLRAEHELYAFGFCVDRIDLLCRYCHSDGNAVPQ